MSIAKRVQALQQEIKITAEAVHRQEDDIRLLAVSKGQSIAAIRAAVNAGLHHIGENYLQEALLKILKLQDMKIHWHFIGPIQSNKTQGIAENFSWVHSVARVKIACLLNNYRPQHLPPLNVCLQINLDKEETKAGLDVEEVPAILKQIKQLPNLHLRGLMTIAKPCANYGEQLQSLLRLTTLFNQLNTTFNLSMDTLSMGMSDDFKAAIAAGSNFLRIGRGIFGDRSSSFSGENR